MKQEVTREEARNGIMESIREATKNLAMQRVMVLKLNVATEEEVTDLINQAGEEYTKKYEAMDPLEIMMEQMMEIVEKKAKMDKEGGLL